MNGDCRGNTNTCILVVWQACNVCMSVFFALAAYVQVSGSGSIEPCYVELFTLTFIFNVPFI